jgi:DNA-binding SARP family transcriptional activator
LATSISGTAFLVKPNATVERKCGGISFAAPNAQVLGAHMLNVCLLGVFRLTGVDNRTWLELGPAGRALASFLFTYPGRPHRRERLADLFWPDLDAATARRALNSAIWRLRKLLECQAQKSGKKLHTVGAETMLEHGPWIDIDAYALERAAKIAMKQAVLFFDPDKLNQVMSALERYEGPFLDGDDGDWVIAERERLHSLFLRTSTVVVRHLGIAGRYDDAIRLARSALRFDPYREELVRNLLTLLTLDEQRGEAIRYYQRWTKSLKTELNISPLPATSQILQEIKAVQSDAAFDALRQLLIGSRSKLQ